MTRRAFLGTLVTVAASLGASGASASQTSVVWPYTLLRDPSSTRAFAATVPAGYWVDVDESGTTTSAPLGGGGYLAATGTGNVNYGWAQECEQTASGGPFSSGHYPPQSCAELGRPNSSAGSPEMPSGFWFTGNEHCVGAGRPFSGAAFTWHVQLPESGSWHVEAHIPSWTMYGQGNRYVVTSDAGQSESVLSQEAFHGQWVTLGGGTHPFTSGHDYTVELTLADTENGFCKYQMADQMRWVLDVPTSHQPPPEEEHHKEEEPHSSGEPPINLSQPLITGHAVEGQTLTVSPGRWDGSPTRYNQQWERCTQSPQSCAPVPGATSTTYRLSATDVEHTLRVRETASNAGGTSAPVDSEESNLVGIPPPPPSPAPEPCAATSAHAASALRSATIGTHAATNHATTAAHHAHRHNRHRGRITLGSALLKTVGSSRHFTLTLELTAGVRHFLNDSCPAPLTGTGIVNFKARAASWTITLPASLGGTIHAVAKRGTIYLSSPQLTPKGGWLALRTRSDYAAFAKVPLVRDIVAATNPLGSVTLLASTRQRPRGRHVARRAVSEPPASFAATAPSVKLPCNNGTQVADSGGETSKQLTDTFSFGTTAEADAITAWSKNHVSAEAGQDGVCDIKVSLENADNNGFDVTVEFANPVPPLHIPTAGLKDAPTYTQTYHYREPCMAGTWEGTDAPRFAGATTSIGTSVSPSVGKGTIRLVMTATSATLETTENFEGGYTHPFPEFTLGPDEELLTVEGTITVPYTAVRTITVSGPVVLTGKDGIALPLEGTFAATVDAPPFTIAPAPASPTRLQFTGTLTCPATLTLDDISLGVLTLSKTSSALAFPVLTSVEQSWQQQLQAASAGPSSGG